MASQGEEKNGRVGGNKRRGEQKEEEKIIVCAFILCRTSIKTSFLPSDSREKGDLLCQRREKRVLCFDSRQIQMNLEVSRKAFAGTDFMSSGFSVYGSQNLPLVGKDHVLGRMTIILVMKTKNVFLFVFPNGPDPARFCVLVTDVFL